MSTERWHLTSSRPAVGRTRRARPVVVDLEAMVGLPQPAAPLRDGRTGIDTDDVNLTALAAQLTQLFR